MFVLCLVAFLALHNISLTGANASFKCKLDLGLVVDTTRSIGLENIHFLENFIKRLIQNVSVSQNGTHVSFETFAATSVLHNKFNNASFYSSKVMEALVDEGIKKLTQPTRLDYAILKADDEMFSPKSGVRAGVRSIMILFTDGKTHPDTMDYDGALQSLRKKAVRIVIVAIGKLTKKYMKYREVLRGITGENEIIYVKDYRILDSVVGDIQAVICPPSPCENVKALDVAFLLDRTRSIGRENYCLLKGFVLEIVDSLDIGPNATHAAFIAFAEVAKVLNSLNNSAYHSNEAVHDLIRDSPNYLGSRAYIDRALDAADQEIFTLEAGSRPNIPRVLILLTDGKTNGNSTPYDNILKRLEEKKVHIAAVGIGKDVLQDELRKIAGDNIYFAHTFSDLPDLFSAILNETCSADGGFTRWSYWSHCSVSCGGDGVQMRTRNCTNPPPQGKGKDCQGDREETKPCNEGACPQSILNGAKKLSMLRRNKTGVKWGWEDIKKEE